MPPVKLRPAALTACGAAANTEKPVVLDPNTQVKEPTITDVVVGTGTAAGDTLSVTYTGWLYDASKPGNKGTQFETNCLARLCLSSWARVS